MDACAYSDAAFDSVTVTVWEPSSGATWQGFITSEQSGGSVTNVTGVGDKAIEGQTELDVQDGDQFISVEGAGGTLTGDDSHAIAMAKALIALLH